MMEQSPQPSFAETTALPLEGGEPDDLMVFDGVCNFCSGYVRMVSMMDREGVIRFTPVQSPYGRLLCQRRGIDPDDPSTFLFFENGRAYEATEGMITMFRRLPAPWRLLRFVAIIPRPLRDAVYRWTARNRYRLLGKRRECMVPSRKVRDRFIFDPPSKA
jgi:predicted DCC family thiol-disulfide oxidoreductase YuxK